jgi:hypothetical protein
MEMKTFCSSMRNEMTAWKAKTYDLIRKAEDMSPKPNPRVKASIDEMKGMISRIEGMLEKLERECPVKWDSEKAEIEQAVCDIQERWNEAASMSPDDFE